MCLRPFSLSLSRRHLVRISPLKFVFFAVDVGCVLFFFSSLPLAGVCVCARVCKSVYPHIHLHLFIGCFYFSFFYLSLQVLNLIFIFCLSFSFFLSHFFGFPFVCYQNARARQYQTPKTQTNRIYFHKVTTAFAFLPLILFFFLLFLVLMHLVGMQRKKKVFYLVCFFFLLFNICAAGERRR